MVPVILVHCVLLIVLFAQGVQYFSHLLEIGPLPPTLILLNYSHVLNLIQNCVVQDGMLLQALVVAVIHFVEQRAVVALKVSFLQQVHASSAHNSVS